MTCLCGDPGCWSCGPAQGYCPKCFLADKDVCDCHDVSPEDDPDWYTQREEWISAHD